MSEEIMATSFKEASAIKQLTSHTYSANFPTDWLLGSVPHGGYVAAVFLKVAETHFKSTLSSQNQPHPIALHIEFLKRTSGGPALFSVKDVKLGRQASVIHVSLGQEGRDDEVVAYITHGNMATEEGVSFPTSYKLTPPPVPVDLKALAEDKDKLWGRHRNMPFSDFRKAATRTQFHFPRAGQPEKSISDEWVRFSSGEPYTAAALGYVCDMYPMPVDAYLESANPYDLKNDKTVKVEKAARYWYPTLLINIDFKKALPEEGVEWLFVRAEAKEIKNGRMDLEMVVKDGDGEIVALAHHIALATGVGKNLAKRSSPKL